RTALTPSLRSVRLSLLTPPPPTEPYTLSLHDALPIYVGLPARTSPCSRDLSSRILRGHRTRSAGTRSPAVFRVPGGRAMPGGAGAWGAAQRDPGAPRADASSASSSTPGTASPPIRPAPMRGHDPGTASRHARVTSCPGHARVRGDVAHARSGGGSLLRGRRLAARRGGIRSRPGARNRVPLHDLQRLHRRPRLAGRGERVLGAGRVHRGDL